MRFNQGRIQPVTLGGAYSASFRSQVSLQVHYRKRDEVYFITLLRQNNGRQKDLILRMLFSELYKIMVSKVTFPGFRGGDRTPPPLDPPLAFISVRKVLIMKYKLVFNRL